MLNLICKSVGKIVSTGVDGTILILPLMFLIYVIVGQAKDCVGVVKKVWREEGADRIS